MINISDVETYYECGPGTLIDTVSDEFLQSFGKFIVKGEKRKKAEYIKIAVNHESEPEIIDTREYYKLLQSFLCSNNTYRREFLSFFL